MLTNLRNQGAVFLTLVILLSACSFSPSVPTATGPDPNMVFTAAAQTASALGTQLALSSPSPAPSTPTPTDTPTVLPAEPTITASLPVTGTAPLPTQAATLTPALTPAPASGDKAEFVADVTIPDGTDLQPGAGFTKTWRLKNVGTTNWSTAYSVVHISNDAISGPASVSLPRQVAPGESVDISVDLVAPETAGTHTSYWKLSNDRGQLFGIGPAANESFYVQIDVGGGASGTPVATSTPGGNGGGGDLISGIQVSLDQPNFTGACPHQYNITVVFTLSKAATITYELEAGSDTPGFTFNLPPAQTSAFTAGTQTLVFNLSMDDTVSGWIRFRITDPEDARSTRMDFSLTCE